MIQSDLLKHLSLDVLYEKCVLRPNTTKKTFV